MKAMIRSSACTILVMLLTQSVMAQSKNKIANHWFEIGRTEKNSEDMVFAFTKAIEFDSLFVEAYYNLGLLYQQQEHFEKSRAFLLKALNAQPDQIKLKFKLEMLSELVVAYKNLQQSDEYEKTLREIITLTRDKDQRTSIFLKLGEFLTEQRRYEDALVELRKGLKISRGGDRTIFNKLIQKVKISIELEPIYATSEKEKTFGNFEKAKSILLNIRAKYPNLAELEEKIAQVDSLIKVEIKEEMLDSHYASLFEEAGRHQIDGRLELAIIGYENLLKKTGSYQDAGQRLLGARKLLERNRLKEKIEDFYHEGTVALRAQDWTRAVVLFEKVLALNDTSHLADQKLAEANRRLHRENIAEKLDLYYTEGIGAMDREDLSGALIAFNKVRVLRPNYRDVNSLLEIIEDAQRQKALTKTTSTVNLDSLYHAAKIFIEQKDWMSAVIALETIKNYQSNFSDVADRLTIARVNLQMADIVKASQLRMKTLYLSGGILGAIMIPIFAVILFSKTARARSHYWRGNYVAAAKIYKKMLENNPGKVRLYEPLANIYMLLGRSDKSAMHVYNTVLQLNLTARNRDRFYQIISQRYLPAGNRNIEPPAEESDSDGDGSIPSFHLEACIKAVENANVSALQEGLQKAAVELSSPVLLSTVVLPLVNQVDKRWAQDAAKLDEEHLLFAVIQGFLERLLANYDAPAAAPKIVVTTVRGQSLEFGALIIAIIAASEGWQVRCFKPEKSVDEIVSVIRKTHAEIIAFAMNSSVDEPLVDEDIRALARELIGEVALIVGGHGAKAHSLLIDEIGGIIVSDIYDLMNFRELFNSLHSGKLQLPRFKLPSAVRAPALETVNSNNAEEANDILAQT